MCMHTHIEYTIYTQMATQSNTESSVFTDNPINAYSGHSDMNSMNYPILFS